MQDIQSFLNSLVSEGTRRTYRAGLKSFFQYLDISPENYFAEDRKYEADVEHFFVKISGNGKAPLTVRSYLTAVKIYLMENDVEFSQRFWRKLSGRIKGKGARTMDEVPSDSTTLKRIFNHMDLKGRALYITLASSGMRIGEALKIRLGDLDLAKEPARIFIRGEYTKNGDPRVCFITSEAKEIISEWLTQRETWIKSASNRGAGMGIKKSLDDDRVFPICSSVALVTWGHALSKAGLVRRDPSTKRKTLHPHILRKWFRTRLGKINVDYTETIMGHAGYLTDAYRRYGVDEVAKWYLENQHHLLIFTDTAELSRLRTDLHNQLDVQQKMMQKLIVEKTGLQARLDDLARRFNNYEAFTKKFMQLTPDELNEIGGLMWAKIEQNNSKNIEMTPEEINEERQRLKAQMGSYASTVHKEAKAITP